VAFVGALAGGAWGQSSPVSQARTTRVFTTVVAAPGFDHFVSSNSSGGPGSPTVQRATQDSSMSASGASVAVGFNWATVGLGVHVIDVESRFSYTFTLAREATYVADGSSVGFIGIGNGTCYAELAGPGGRVFILDGNAPVALPHHRKGSLGAGNYTLSARCETAGSTQVPGSGGQGGITFVLTLQSSACPADFNDDGGVNSQDFFDFLGAFFVQDPSADFNSSGSVDSQDFFDFLAAFFGGC
jgi:hypothetical protein